MHCQLKKKMLNIVQKIQEVMHSCAHDGHTTYLMVLAQTLIEMKDKLVGKIVIIHQPAEETPQEDQFK